MSEKTECSGSDTIVGAMVLTYLLVGFLTFGWIYDKHPNSDGAGAFIGGLFWPIYWPGYGSLNAVHWLREPRPDCYVDGVAYQPDPDGICRVITHTK